MIRLNIETFTDVVGRGALRAPSPCRPESCALTRLPQAHGCAPLLPELAQC